MINPMFPAEQRKSFLHLRDPGIKIALLFLFISAVSLTPSQDIRKFGLYSGILLAVIVLSRIPAKVFLHRILLLFPLLLFPGASLLLFSEFSSWKKMEVFLFIALRAALCICFMAVIVATTKFSEAIRSLRRLGVPRLGTSLLVLAHRYAGLLLKEASRMKSAWVCRAGSPSYRDSVRMVRHLVPRSMFRALDRADRIYSAMLCRGFNGDLPIDKKNSLDRWDMVFFLAVTSAVICGWVLL